MQEEFQERILFGFLEGIWSLDIIYQGQRPIPETDNDSTNDHDAQEEDDNNNKFNNEDQENFKRDFFAMLEDVIELSSEYPSVLVDPEFSIVHYN